MNQKDFLGSGLRFPLQIDPATGKIAMAAFEEDIQEAVSILLRTYQGERVMRPGFGTTSADYLFGSVSQNEQENMVYRLKRELQLQEPRIQNIAVSCEAPDNGTLILHISYTVRSTNNRYNMVYPFYTIEGGTL